MWLCLLLEALAGGFTLPGQPVPSCMRLTLGHGALRLVHRGWVACVNNWEAAVHVSCKHLLACR